MNNKMIKGSQIKIKWGNKIKNPNLNKIVKLFNKAKYK
jgi:hypothetical protein